MSLEQRGGLIAYFARNPVAANLMMLIMLLGGLMSGLALTAQVFPTIDPGTITVQVAYPGATPSEVEEGITRRVEEAVLGIDGVKRVQSRASENLGSVTIELKDYVNAGDVRDDVESAVEQLADFPPEEAEQPDIVMADTVSDVLTLVVSSELPERSLRSGALQLEEALLALPEVTLINTMGARDFEIAIEIPENTLRRYDLTMEAVAAAIRRSSLNLSSGELRTQGGDLLLRTSAKRMQGHEFASIVLRANADGSLLRLGDVATIRDGFADVDLINQFNGKDALLIKVQKSEAEDALEIAEAVKMMLTRYDPPAGINVSIWDDQTDVLQQRVSLLVRNGLLGFAMVFLFLVIMLDLRLALWVAMGVPIAFLGAFLFFEPFGVNINMVSLFALIIVLGIVVDDAVVVGENIIAEQEQGKPPVQAALDGVRGVAGPVLVGVMTTMAAFAPLMFVTGQFGQIMGVVPVVVITVLAMSLLEAFLILPSHLTHGGNWSRYPLDAFQNTVASGVVWFRLKVLTPLLRRAISRRYLTVLGGVALLVAAGALFATGGVRFLFFPSLEANTIRATLEFPVGTPFAVTRAGAEQLIAGAKSANESVGGTSFSSMSTTIGGRSRASGGPSGGGSMTIASHLASVQIALADEPLRTLSAPELERIWRREVGDIAGAERLTFVAQFFRSGADIEYELAHQDTATLMAAVEKLKTGFAAYPALFEIQDSDSPGKREYDISLTREGEVAGLTPSAVARQLRRQFFGEEVQRIQRGRSELKVMLRYPRGERESTNNFFNARIRLPDGSTAPLSTVASVKESRSLAAINRVDGLRIISVSARVDDEISTPTEMSAVIDRELVQALRSEVPGLQVMEAGAGREQSEDLASLGRMMLISLMVIFAMMASQLRSYGQPLIILTGVPFGAAGAIVGHYLLGFDVSFISIFGMVALSGVVVNDSLVLVDRYNRLRNEDGMPAVEAAIAAANRRFRAIFLTTVTTALGLTPMLLETSTQAQFLIPMAVSLATGIVFASVIILFVVPALLVIREDFRRQPVPDIPSAGVSPA